MVKQLVAGASVLVLAACTPGADASPAPSASPSVEYPTYEQQSAALTVTVSGIANALSSFNKRYPGQVPAVVETTDEIHVSDTRVPIEPRGVSIEILGTAGDFCVELSVPNADPAQVELVYASKAGTETFTQRRCADQYIDAGQFPFPDSNPPGYYLPAEVYAEAGLCFNKAVHVFIGSVEKQVGWQVVDCSKKHLFEIYGAGQVDADFFKLDDDAQWVWMEAACAADLEGYRPARDKAFVVGDMWRPVGKGSSPASRGYLCSGYYV